MQLKHELKCKEIAKLRPHPTPPWLSLIEFRPCIVSWKKQRSTKRGIKRKRNRWMLVNKYPKPHPDWVGLESVTCSWINDWKLIAQWRCQDISRQVHLWRSKVKWRKGQSKSCQKVTFPFWLKTLFLIVDENAQHCLSNCQSGRLHQINDLQGASRILIEAAPVDLGCQKGCAWLNNAQHTMYLLIIYPSQCYDLSLTEKKTELKFSHNFKSVNIFEIFLGNISQALNTEQNQMSRWVSLTGTWIPGTIFSFHLRAIPVFCQSGIPSQPNFIYNLVRDAVKNYLADFVR